MEQHLGSVSTRHVIMTGGEYAGLICLAVVGVLSVISSVASQAYSLGRDTKEREMRREFKKCMKQCKKEKES